MQQLNDIATDPDDENVKFIDTFTEFSAIAQQIARTNCDKPALLDDATQVPASRTHQQPQTHTHTRRHTQTHRHTDTQTHTYTYAHTSFDSVSGDYQRLNSRGYSLLPC